MLDIFLTAYDPSDLPGTSVDPLGFERGYLFLADKILPGLTNVASRPRYFALLCAGIQLSGSHGGKPEREAIRQRQDTILRLERFWALANVLAKSDDAGGVRGVSYAREYATELKRRGEKRTTANYRLLSRQSQYGAIGMYASVADGMQFFNRDDFVLTPALGEVAAVVFVEETDLPSKLRRAIIENSDVSLSVLADWGQRAHVEGEVKVREATCLRDALHSNDVRSRMIDTLKGHPAKDGSELELSRLQRILRSLERKGQHDDLREAIACILAYEECYQQALLAFERILWLCRHHAGASITLMELARDPVLLSVKAKLPACVRMLTETMDLGCSLAFREDLNRLSDVRRFLEHASGAVEDNSAFVDAILQRHTDIQHGKFDRGRRKMPWIERNANRITLTMARSSGSNREVIDPAQIANHPFRLGAADAFIAASLNAA